MPPIQLQMPALSPTMTSGTLRRWLVREGQEIVPGQPYAEVETDKAVMEIEAADAGVLGRILVPDDTEDVPVNAAIGVLLEEGETLDDLETGAAGAAAPPPPTEPEPPASKAVSSAPPGEPSPHSGTQAGAGRAAAEVGLKPGTGERARRIFVSPLARRLAQKRGYNLELLTGTGPRGRIILRDVTAFSASPSPAGAGTRRESWCLFPSAGSTRSPTRRRAPRGLFPGLKPAFPRRKAFYDASGHCAAADACHADGASFSFDGAVCSGRALGFAGASQCRERGRLQIIRK